MANADQVMLKVAEQIERAVDDELERIDHMDDDELLILRRKRIEHLKEMQNRRDEWIKKGHSVYSEVSDPQEFFNIVQNSERVVVHFMRRSTPRCSIMDRHFQRIAAEHFETKFCYVDVERVPSLPQRFNVVMLPHVMLVEKKNTFHSIIGFDEFGGSDEFTTGTVKDVLSTYGMINANGMFAADQSQE
jgi:hypothetical protein